METEALDFPEAVETLADRYGVRVEREEDDPQAEQRRRRRERLMALLDRAAGYYAAYLWDSGEAPARSYPLGRGFGGGAARVQGRLLPERLGSHAPGARRGGFSEEELAAAGLAQRGSSGALRPLPRPDHVSARRSARAGPRIRRPPDEGGGVGRSTRTLPRTSHRQGRQLFGIDRARGPAAKTGRIVLVEGYTDVLALHQTVSARPWPSWAQPSPRSARR